MRNISLTTLITSALLLISSIIKGQNPIIENGVATYTTSTIIGKKFQVPDSWNKIVIKANVTLTGSFYFPTRTRGIEIAGENRYTSIIKGTGDRPEDDGIDGRSYCAVRADKDIHVHIHDLKSLNPDKFHFYSRGAITVENCEIIDNRGQVETDGVHCKRGGGTVRNCFISTYDDCMYAGDVSLIENTTIEHNSNGAPFQISWGGNSNGKSMTIKNVTIIDCSTRGYNQGVVGWARKNDAGTQKVTITFEGENIWKTKSGAKTSKFYTFSSGKNSAVNNATVIHKGTNCDFTKSFEQRNGSSGVVVQQCYCENITPNAWDLSKPLNYNAQGTTEPSRNAIHIDTTQQPTEEWATAHATFQGETNKYSIVLSTLLERNGESFYRLLIDGNLVMEFQNPRIHGTSTNDYTTYNMGKSDIIIQKGADIQVDYKTNSNNLVIEGEGFAYTSAFWKGLNIGLCNITVDSWYDDVCQVSDVTQHIKVNTNDIVDTNKVTLIAGDSLMLSIVSDSADSLYIIWEGPNGFSAIDTNQIIINPVQLSHAGTYTARYINRKQCESLIEFHVNVKCGELGSEWSAIDIGAVDHIGASCGFNTITVNAGGGDIWGQADRCHFVYTKLVGDGGIIAKVNHLDAPQDWSMGGVMMRESLDADSKQISMLLIHSPGSMFRRRTETGGSTTQGKIPDNKEKAPFWVKLARQGDIIAGYSSSDGVNWNLWKDKDNKLGYELVDLGDTIYIGLAATSHTSASSGISTYSNITYGSEIKVINIPSSIAEIQENNLKIYPNPAKNTLNIKTDKKTIHSVLLYDITGKLKYSAPTVSEHTKIDVSNFNSGIYFLILVHGNIVSQQKIVIK